MLQSTTPYWEFFMKLITLLVCSFVFLFAELPPRIYDELKAASPEILYIRVLHVEKSGEDVSVKAKVLEVKRTSSGIKENDEIEIFYTIPYRPFGWVGPSRARLVEERVRYSSFLSCENKKCHIAAKGKSFMEVAYINDIKEVQKMDFE